MARDILGEFGPESPNQQKARAKTGGVKQARDVLGYRMPQGPTNIADPDSPGLHGNVYRSGSQTSSIRGGESGDAGIGGSSHKSGSQR